MRLYAIKAVSGLIADWAGTQADAKAAATHHPCSTWEEVDVPTDKPGLITWLKQHAVSTPGK